MDCEFFELFQLMVKIYITSATPDCFRSDWNR